jgi:hypothetical protein
MEVIRSARCCAGRDIAARCPYPSRVTVSVSDNPASNWEIVWDRPGKTRFGAISLKG